MNNNIEVVFPEGPAITGVMHKPDFADKFDSLEMIFVGQRDLMEKYHHMEEANGSPVISPLMEGMLDDRRVQARLKELAQRMIEELCEGTSELKNSPWHQADRPTDVEAFREEVADVLHFFVEFCITAGIDATQLHELYFAKKNKNRVRLNTGY